MARDFRVGLAWSRSWRAKEGLLSHPVWSRNELLSAGGASWVVCWVRAGALPPAWRLPWGVARDAVRRVDRRRWSGLRRCRDGRARAISGSPGRSPASCARVESRSNPLTSCRARVGESGSLSVPPRLWWHEGDRRRDLSELSVLARRPGVARLGVCRQQGLWVPEPGRRDDPPGRAADGESGPYS